VAGVFDIPLTQDFRGITRRRGLVWRGIAGWAEFSPFEDYSPAGCVPWWQAANEAAAEGYPPPVREWVPVNGIVPAVSPEVAIRLVSQFRGCTTAKVKVAQPGQTLAEEVARVAAVRGALGLGGKIRIDANGAWDVETAAAHIAALNRAAGGLEFAEQPCGTVAELAQLRRRTSVPIAADESVRRSSDPFRVEKAGAADLIVLKVQPLGGVRACLALAERVSLPVVVSSAVETSIGLAAGLALAGALPQLDFACGLGTLQLMSGDVTDDPLVPVDGFLRVRNVSADPALLAHWEAGPAVQQWWRRRIDQVRALANSPGTPRAGL
jgi:O-succinylbenzoate synthase